MGHGMNEELGLELFHKINQITLPGEGITRPSYSDKETDAMKVIAWHAHQLGLDISWDFAGNLHVRLPSPLNVPDVAFGSHLDSVPSGGRYDGTAGVVAGLLVLERAVREKRALAHSLRLIVFRGEESAWFGKCYLGSSALFGLMTEDQLMLQNRDEKNGATLLSAMRSCLADPGAIKGKARLAPSRLGRFYELHIEQGPVLEAANEPVAFVTSISGNYRYLSCKAFGETGHSGTTPQHMRKDALLATAELLNDLQLVCTSWNNLGDTMVFTCGKLSTDVETHSVSVIPGTVSFTIEFRSGNSATLQRFDKVFKQAVADIFEAYEIRFVLGEPIITEPVTLDYAVLRDLTTLAPKVRHMPSGAGHDAAVLQSVGVPTGMIFVRNGQGSHNPLEDMRMDDFLEATDLLYRAVTSPL